MPKTSNARPLVVVDGCGPAVAQVASLLQAEAVCRVWAGIYAADSAPSRVARPALVVAVAPLAPPDALGWLVAGGIPHLPVLLGPDQARVGPLVRPGLDPCLGCVAAARRESLRESIGPPAPGRTPAGLTALAASAAALFVAAHLAGECPGGVSLEAQLPWPRFVQREWTRHPLCRCGIPAGTAALVG